MFLTLPEYARSVNKSYRTVYKHFLKGYLKIKIQRIKGQRKIFVLGKLRIPKPGRPMEWTREKILRCVHALCNDKYVEAKDFPPYLYKLCISKKYGIGSVRAAKWEARILIDQRKKKRSENNAL